MDTRKLSKISNLSAQRSIEDNYGLPETDLLQDKPTNAKLLMNNIEIAV